MAAGSTGEAMDWDTPDVLAARAIVPHLPALLGARAGEVRAELVMLLDTWDRYRELPVTYQIMRLLADDPATHEWMRDFLRLSGTPVSTEWPAEPGPHAPASASFTQPYPIPSWPPAAATPAREAAPDLLVRTGRTERTLHDGGIYRIGRDPASDIAMTDIRVSWRHAALRVEEGGWVLEDLGSTNGTFLGAQRVDRVQIDADRVMRLGHPEDGPVLRCTPQVPAAQASAHPASAQPTLADPPGLYAGATGAMAVPEPPSRGDSGAWWPVPPDTAAPSRAAAPPPPSAPAPEPVSPARAAPDADTRREEAATGTQAPAAEPGADSWPAPGWPAPALGWPPQAGPPPPRQMGSYPQAPPPWPGPAYPPAASPSSRRSGPGITRRTWAKLRDTIAPGSRRPGQGAAAAAPAQHAEPAIGPVAPAQHAEPAIGPVAPAQHAEPAIGPVAPPGTVYGLLRCPDNVSAQQEFELEVGLSALASPGVAGGPMTLPPVERRTRTLSVQLQIFGFGLREGESAQQSMPLSWAAPYPSVTLHLTPDAQRDDRVSRRIKAMYSVDGQPIGFAVRYVTVTRGPRHWPEGTMTAGGENLSIPAAPTPADLTVAVERKPGSDRELVWLFQSPHDVDLPAGAVVTDIGPFASLQDFARNLTNQLSASEGQVGVFATIMGKGRRIAAVMPAEFWSLLRQAAELAAGPPTILFLTDQPYVPWELAALPWPLDPDPELPPFLCAQARVGRWLQPDENAAAAGLGPVQPPPTSVQVRAMAVVSGVYGQPGWPRLLEAEAECAALERDYGAAKVEASQGPVFSCIFGTPSAEVLHFAVHGTWDPAGAEDGLILVDGVLSPDQVLSGRLAGHPLVFLNACQVGQGSEALGDYAGMAAAFLRIGASAVVAPLWSIDDATARSIALAFYRETLVNGASPAEVLRRIRAEFKPANIAQSSTYLAYQFFGDPRLELVRAPAAPPWP